MIDILRRLRRIALRRGQQEFQRWHETWNPPYSLLGTAAVGGLMGAALCLAWTIFAAMILIWEMRHDPMYWPIVVLSGIVYGAAPGMVLGAISGLALALAWTRRLRLSKLACLVGGAVVMGRLVYFMYDQLAYDPEWRVSLPQLLFLFASSLWWAGILIGNGLRMLRKPLSPNP